MYNNRLRILENFEIQENIGFPTYSNCKENIAFLSFLNCRWQAVSLIGTDTIYRKYYCKKSCTENSELVAKNIGGGDTFYIMGLHHWMYSEN